MKLVKLVSVLSGLAVTAMSSLALADIPPSNGGGGCSMASTSGQMTIVGLMFVVGAAILFVSRRRTKG